MEKKSLGRESIRMQIDRHGKLECMEKIEVYVDDTCGDGVKLW